MAEVISDLQEIKLNNFPWLVLRLPFPAVAAVAGVVLFNDRLTGNGLRRFRTVVEVDALCIALPRLLGQIPFVWRLILPIDHLIQLDNVPARAVDTC